MFEQQEYDRTDNDSASRTTRFLPNSGVEVIHDVPPTAPRHVLFDFDGTLSLIREGWPDVMVPMMVEILRATGTEETPQVLRELVLRFVMELNGKQTIYQMIRLAEEVERRGTMPSDPLEYKNLYHDRLMQRIQRRRDGLASGSLVREAMLVPGTLGLLESLAARDVVLYLASGTDEQYVREEVRLLGLDKYFGRHIYGAQDDYRQFSKAMVIERILTENHAEGPALLGFGDGYVEIENIKAVGGTAVGVASDEAHRSGKPDPWKRDRLMGVGADVIIPDFGDYRPLLALIWNETE